MNLALKQHRIIINLSILAFIAISLLIFLPSRVEASEPVKAEMYMGDYEIRKNKVGSSFVYEEVKYLETGSAKVIKRRTTTNNTWISSYYHTNHQGSTSVVTANNGRVDTEYSRGRLRYFPYGEQITSHNINTQAVTDTYTGQKRDTESNLMFYNARLYNQKTGLFMQADSVNDGLNRYAYVSGNPVNATDPTGNWCVFGLGDSCTKTIKTFNDPRSQQKSIIQPLNKEPYSDRWAKIRNTIDTNLQNNLLKLYGSSHGEEIGNWVLENEKDNVDLLGAMALAVQQSIVYNPDLASWQINDAKAKEELNEYKTGSFSMAAFENYREQADYHEEKGWREYFADSDLLSRVENNKTICFDFAIIMGIYMKEKGYEGVEMIDNGYMGHSYLIYGDLVVDPTWGTVFNKEDHQNTFGYETQNITLNRGLINYNFPVK